MTNVPTPYADGRIAGADRLTEVATLSSPRRGGSRAWIAYCAPAILFSALTAVEGLVPRPMFPVFYSAKILAVCATILAFRAPLRDIRPIANLVVPSLLIGGFVFVVWVGIEELVPYPHLGTRIGFNPWTEISAPGGAWAFVAVRLLGLAVLVPVMEEIFWRSFLLRYMTVPHFLEVPIGTFSRSAFWMVVGAFALAHTEWLAAAVTGVVYALWLARTRSLFAVIVAHAATNAALGAYVLVAQDWRFW
jgi:CAAX prenyl protease-like protein